MTHARIAPVRGGGRVHAGPSAPLSVFAFLYCDERAWSGSLASLQVLALRPHLRVGGVALGLCLGLGRGHQLANDPAH